MKILLPVDGSKFTKQMLAWLATHEEWLSGQHEFTILTVTPAIPPHAASVFSVEDLKEYYENCSEAVFKPIRKFLAKHDLATRYEAKVGHPPEVIANLAWEGGTLGAMYELVGDAADVRFKDILALAKQVRKND